MEDEEDEEVMNDLLSFLISISEREKRGGKKRKKVGALEIYLPNQTC